MSHTASKLEVSAVNRRRGYLGSVRIFQSRWTNCPRWMEMRLIGASIPPKSGSFWLLLRGSYPYPTLHLPSQKINLTGRVRLFERILQGEVSLRMSGSMWLMDENIKQSDGLTSEPADRPKYFDAPSSPIDKVPSASMVSLTGSRGGSVSVLWPTCTSGPNLIANSSSRSRGWISEDAPNWKIVSASSNCRIRWPISAIFRCSCSVSASTNLDHRWFTI